MPDTLVIGRERHEGKAEQYSGRPFIYVGPYLVGAACKEEQHI
jgi:hypothetical protein